MLAVSLALFLLCHSAAAVKMTFIEVKIEKLSGQGGNVNSKEKFFQKDSSAFCSRSDCNKLDPCTFWQVCGS